MSVVIAVYISCALLFGGANYTAAHLRGWNMRGVAKACIVTSVLWLPIVLAYLCSSRLRAEAVRDHAKRDDEGMVNEKR